MDPERMAQYELTPADIASALREQNAQFAAGRIGAQPAESGQAFTLSVSTPGWLTEPDDFEDVIIRSDADGQTLRLGQVADVELGAQGYDFSATYNSQAAVPLASTCSPAPTRWRPPRRCARPSRTWDPGFPTGLSTRSPTTPRNSSRPPYRRW
nr:efflux RND transporter permease subunit [Aquisalimonas sp.]